jgi:predicted nucleic-acid-binding protein
MGRRGQILSIIADTKVFLRAIINDDPEEAEKARRLFAQTDRIILATTTICETIWVLRSRYRVQKAQLVQVVIRLLQTEKLALDRAAVEAGLALLEVGGDFADGVIAFEGRRLGGETFATFDKEAATLLKATGQNCLLLTVD